MPLDINTSIDFLKTRVDQTLSVISQIAGIWTWPVKTTAEWETDSLQLDKAHPDSLAAKAIAAETRTDSARSQLDQRLAEMHRQTLAVVGVMRVRSQRSPEHSDVVDELSARGDSRPVIEDEAAALLAAWSEEFGTDFSPAPDIDYGGFQRLFIGDDAEVPPVPSLRALKQALSNAATVARRDIARVNVLLNRVENDTQQWYAEATSVFPAGTETGDLIRAVIPTTTSYNPPTPAAAPVPTP